MRFMTLAYPWNCIQIFQYEPGSAATKTPQLQKLDVKICIWFILTLLYEKLTMDCTLSATIATSFKDIYAPFNPSWTDYIRKKHINIITTTWGNAQEVESTTTFHTVELIGLTFRSLRPKPVVLHSACSFSGGFCLISSLNDFSVGWMLKHLKQSQQIRASSPVVSSAYLKKFKFHCSDNFTSATDGRIYLLTASCHMEIMVQ